jgi:hypothetical protein
MDGVPGATELLGAMKKTTSSISVTKRYRAACLGLVWSKMGHAVRLSWAGKFSFFFQFLSFSFCFAVLKTLIEIQLHFAGFEI